MMEFQMRRLGPLIIHGNILKMRSNGGIKKKKRSNCTLNIIIMFRFVVLWLKRRRKKKNILTMHTMGSWMHGCLIAVIVSDWLRLIKSRVIAALAVKNYVTAETKAAAFPTVCLLKRTSLPAWLCLCPPFLICINNWGLSPEDTWLQNMSSEHKGFGSITAGNKQAFFFLFVWYGRHWGR